MALECRFFATFRSAVGQKTIELAIDSPTTVRTVLADLETTYEGLAETLLTADGTIQDGLSVLKNGRDVTHMQGAKTRLTDGDTLGIFPPVAGGTTTVTREFRGISRRMAIGYLTRLGGEQVDEQTVKGEQWSASITESTVEIGPSLTVTELSITFRGSATALDQLVPDFHQKALRAGG